MAPTFPYMLVGRSWIAHEPEKIEQFWEWEWVPTSRLDLFSRSLFAIDMDDVSYLKEVMTIYTHDTHYKHDTHDTHDTQYTLYTLYTLYTRYIWYTLYFLVHTVCLYSTRCNIYGGMKRLCPKWSSCNTSRTLLLDDRSEWAHYQTHRVYSVRHPIHTIYTL